jgi:hypothetical protein
LKNNRPSTTFKMNALEFDTLKDRRGPWERDRDKGKQI